MTKGMDLYLFVLGLVYLAGTVGDPPGGHEVRTLTCLLGAGLPWLLGLLLMVTRLAYLVVVPVTGRIYTGELPLHVLLVVLVNLCLSLFGDKPDGRKNEATFVLGLPG